MSKNDEAIRDREFGEGFSKGGSSSKIFVEQTPSRKTTILIKETRKKLRKKKIKKRRKKKEYLRKKDEKDGYATKATVGNQRGCDQETTWDQLRNCSL